MSDHPALQEAIRSFLKSGGTVQEIQEMATATADRNQRASNGASVQDGGRPSRRSGDLAGLVKMYETVPPHLMTIAEAAEEHDMTRQAVYQWIRMGRISEAGILRGGAGNRLNVTLLDRAEFTTLITGTTSTDGVDGLPIYNSIPDDLITVTDACKKYKRSVTTLRRWWRNGYIQLMGRVRGPAPGGGYLLVSVDEIEAHISNPPYKRGRPPK